MIDRFTTHFDNTISKANNYLKGHIFEDWKLTELPAAYGKIPAGLFNTEIIHSIRVVITDLNRKEKTLERKTEVMMVFSAFKTH